MHSARGEHELRPARETLKHQGVSSPAEIQD